MRKLLVAGLMVVLSTPAFAAIQNVKVSGNITSSFVDRSNFDLGSTTAPLYTAGLKKQNVFLTQTEVRIDADLSDNVSAQVGLINERAWNNHNGLGNSNAYNDTNVDLYLANLTLREFLYSPLTLTIGRQVFFYGNGLILGNGPANQTNGGLEYIDQDLGWSTAEDGIKAVLDYKPLTIDLIYFRNDETNAGIQGLWSGSNYNRSSEVFGYNANYQLSDPWNTVVEQYMFNRIDESGYTGTGKGGNTLYVPGLRASTNPIKGLNVQGEIAWQLGQNVVSGYTEHRDAMAIQALASYSLPVLPKYKPTVNASYTYFSGDKTGAVSSSGHKYSAWDVFMGDLGAGTIYSSIYPLTNMNIVSAGASVNPLEDLTAAFTWSNLWAADSYSSKNPLQIYQPNEGSTLYTMATKTSNRSLGNEYDVNLTYNYTEDVTFGVSLGWYVPGSALSNTNRDTASQAIASLGVKF
ncbi:MAG: alginate export family protein [Candidatus Omnitrophica bacterium]|nr:alginate export family protein [Candidatus Omnitrophota bacterium]MDE2231471.1 alginate export family protein [Candidatus Omnitrophota bacterium]